MKFHSALNRFPKLTLTFALIGTVATAGMAFAKGAEKIRPLPEKIAVLPDSPIDIEVWTERGENGRYCVGDPIAIYFRTNADAWVSILDTDTRGRTHKLFPNRWDRDHFVEAGRVYRLPADGYRFEVEGPAGRETLHAIAAHDRRELRRAAERLMSHYEHASYKPTYKPNRGSYHYKYSDKDNDYDLSHRKYETHSETVRVSSRYESPREKIAVIPVPEDFGYDSASHLVRDGKRCSYPPTRPTRPWWRR